MILRKCMRSVLRFFLLVSLLRIIMVLIQEHVFKSNQPTTISTAKNVINGSDEYACFYTNDEDMLLTFDKTLTFPHGSIFFIVTSCRRSLSSREACAIESAAKANPDRQVNLLFATPVSPNKVLHSPLTLLLTIPNVEAMRIHLENFAEGTPLYFKFKQGPVSRETWNMDIADVLKFLTIYKYGGVYISLDVIITQSFRDLIDNWVVKESPASMSSDIFSFSENNNGRLLAEIALNNLVSDLGLPERMDLWSLGGFDIMNKLMLLWCKTENILNLVTRLCKDLLVLEPEQFYPITFYSRNELFIPGLHKKRNEQNIFGYHTWGEKTRNMMILNESLYAHLAQTYCPRIYALYGHRFGT
ncbi:alpha-1,4-N-acetylglucosaminyltransferase-like [Anticarsia gemmatalis]|uniref:alpha-1,4-N-acetylglucosaminyltransferase-like n=1 Tax=Anticarsia gemmatalis TaxID=129554 RepID=UPI003F776A73